MYQLPITYIKYQSYLSSTSHIYQVPMIYIKYQSYISSTSHIYQVPVIYISAANDTVVAAFLLLTSSCVAAEELIEDG